jgi:phosphatidylserine/phosphatidylglycerophosphate/cardiolipin synthase-like enzyme
MMQSNRTIFWRFLVVTLLVSSTVICSPLAQARQSTQTAFSPSPKAVKLVQRTIDKAKQSIDVAAYSFTSHKIADALIKAHELGVTVRVLLDKGQGKRHYKAIEELQEAGIPIRINRHYAIMHNKYLIIDKNTVETGSFNYTQNAEKHNAENVVVIKNNKKLTKEFMENWQKLWDEGEEYGN